MCSPRITSRKACALIVGLVVTATSCHEVPPTGPDEASALAADVAAASVAPAFIQVTPGFAHTCGLTGGGVIYCWGYNFQGQLGDGTTTSRVTPVVVHAGALRFRQVAAGDYHTCALTTDDRAYCWGDNGYGQLGTGTIGRQFRPAAVAGGLEFRQLSAGGFGHTCGVTASGLAYCWGHNEWGQLGDGTSTDRVAPTPVAGRLTFSQVLPGAVHTCGTTTAQVAYCWGYNVFGQLGDGTVAKRLTPTRVAGDLKFTHVSAGDHTCGVTTDAKAYCWGDNFRGKLGDGTTTDRHRPTLVAGGLRFDGVSAGSNASCGITAAGRVYCWGSNSYGQLGDGTIKARLTPTATVGGILFDRVNTAGTHACAVTGAGKTYCWGSNYAGQLGDGTTTDRRRPTRVGGG
jgi:alpha-tubulin suppressor-like RCC1 family protein